MKKGLLVLFISICNTIYSQSNLCGQAEVANHFFNQHPDWKPIFEENQKSMPTKKSVIDRNKSSAPNYMVPVVFHIIHQNGSENISDDQVADQIRILNRDYQKRNADTSLIVSPFDTNIANVGFGFRLAKIDPEGNCTNGIIRHLSPKTNWDANNLADFTFSWPRNKYLNIYVVKTLNITATAYAFLPGTPIPIGADVIVTLHNMVGSIGTGTVANSRVLTHEVGHWFGLQHIWGTSNQPGVICGDDLVDDTPITKGFVSCDINNTGICTPGIPENVQNYMDYSPCKIMFTNGQADRMLDVMTGNLNNRNNISSEPNLVSTGISGPNYTCSPSVDFKASRLKGCVNTSIKFTSLTQSGRIPGIRLWTFEGGSPETSSDSIPVVTYTNPGTYLVSLKVITPGDTVIETRENYISIVNPGSGENIPFAFDFETDSLIPKLSILGNDNNSISWELNTTLGALGSSKCFMLNSFNDLSDIKGKRDLFELPFINFTGADNISLSFYYAYARLSSAQRDSFKVQYSVDCGGSWVNINGLPTMAQLGAASGGTTSDEFIPNANDWKEQIIPSNRLLALVNQPGVKIRFLFVRDIAKTTTNNFYIDQIQLNGTISGNQQMIPEQNISIFPNPSNGSFWVKVNSLKNYNIIGQLFDIHGRILPDQIKKSERDGLVINSESKLSKGIYTLMLNLDGQMFPQKLVVN